MGVLETPLAKKVPIALKTTVNTMEAHLEGVEGVKLWVNISGINFIGQELGSSQLSGTR